MLKEESDKNKQKAADLAEEGMDEAAKRRLAVYLLCRQLRTKEEAVMADLDAARLQMVMQTDHPTGQTIEKVNKALRESVNEREKATQAFNRMSFLTQVNVEQSTSELEDYGIKKNTLEDEYRKLTGKKVEASSKVKPIKNRLPEVPTSKQETEAKQAQAPPEKMPEKS